MAAPVTAEASPEAEVLGQVFADIGEACPGFEAAEPAPSGRDELFVEAAVLDVPSELAKEVALVTLPELARSPSIRLLGAPHVVARFDAKADFASGQTGDSSTPAALASWSILPRHVDTDVSALDFELQLSALNQPGGAPLRKTVRFSATTRDNAPVLARVVWHEAKQRSLLILFRTFRIQGEAELRAIFECKMHQRERHVLRLRTQPRAAR